MQDRFFQHWVMEENLYLGTWFSQRTSKLNSVLVGQSELKRIVRKPDFCICENKDADQLRGNHEADQRLCFRYIDSTISLLPIYEISSL